MTTLFGIKNCDTVKKARSWLDSNNIRYHFHDFRTDGLTQEQIQQWLASVGIEKLVNKRSTTWKQLSENDQKRALGPSAVEIIGESPTLIKRPVLEQNDAILIGFNEQEYKKLFKT